MFSEAEFEILQEYGFEKKSKYSVGELISIELTIGDDVCGTFDIIDGEYVPTEETLIMESIIDKVVAMEDEE